MKIQKNFFYTTSVNVCEEQLAIPMYGFDLVSFNDIQSRAFGDMFLIGKFLMLFVIYAQKFYPFFNNHLQSYTYLILILIICFISMDIIG